VPINATPAEARAAAAEYDQYQHAPPAKGPGKPYSEPKRAAPAAASEPYPDTSKLQYLGHARHAAGQDFEHSAYVMLIDKHGVQRVGIPFEALTPSSLAQDLRTLLAEPA
jgi:cytochrome oxidase Cu insertion factor (SCO1/SenC/PrrC family)